MRAMANQYPTTNDPIARIVQAAIDCRLAAVFDDAVGKFDSFVVAGASGMISQRTVSGLSQAGFRPLALIDNNVALQGSDKDGIPVLSPSEAVRKYPNAVFVAAIFTHTPLRKQLTDLGAARVISYATLFHKFPGVFLPYFAVDTPAIIANQAQAVMDAATIWADDESRALYTAILNWFVTLDSESVPAQSPPQTSYLPDLLKLREDEVFVDCGAFDGDTVRHYAKASQGRYREIVALEPDPKTFPKLSACAAKIDRVTALNAAAGAEAGSMLFVAGGSEASHAASAGAAGFTAPGEIIEVDVIRIDDLSPFPTYVKMDLEGFEQQALTGARGILGAGGTAFGVTLYHRMSDLWTIPLYIHNVAPDLKLFLRHYAEDWGETIVYAVPADRVNVSG
jgi:FkbM family methyltransferase